MIEYCLGFAFDDSLQYVVLIKKQRPEWQKGLLNGVGGKVEEGEYALDAMEREFEEEAGLRYDNWHHFGFLKGTDWVVYLYTATLTNQQLADIDCNKTDENITITNISNLFYTVPNLRWLVPMARYCLQKEEFFQINEISLQ